MVETFPGEGFAPSSELVACIEACLGCAQSCTACADACLSEEHVGELRRCIRLNADCADVCSTTAAVLSRQTSPDLELVRAVLQACMTACAACGTECEQHAQMHEHCAVCARACRACEQACRALLAELG
ncbi:four-helix bundle copper-binding protein [Xylanimonas oleitrophica]|uniref:Four-helix bundle copper-binding protein n=1 Tax=Xylanimonas oleitrophica TaxID=2607479 RepID=A0A2W5WLL7_9MICO|nr:four-helix bundle copper-binding protein [Xylanimonas oleitrophica]PZR52449.1 four-helix bundle copper-binding protein [Xylanimonas oleitrophica]